MGTQFLKSKKMTKEIDRFHQTIFIEEVCIQAHHTILAHKRLLDFISDERNHQRTDVWIHIQSFLSHAAMIAKYIQPSHKAMQNPPTKQRVKFFSECFDISDDSLRLMRKVRNNIEHLDERLDQWMEVDGRHLLQSVFKSREGLEYLNPTTDGAARWFIKRVYLIDEDTFVSQGKQGLDEINLAAVICEVRRIKRIAEQFSLSSSVQWIFPQQP